MAVGVGPGCTTLLETDASLINVHYYQNALRDLLGTVRPPTLTNTGADPDLLVSRGIDRMSASLAFELGENARAVSVDVLEQQGLRSCVEPECAFAVISGLAERAFRHPLSAEETASLRLVFEQGLGTSQDVQGASRLATEAILQAPSFLYLTEFGTQAPATGERLLTDYEVMARLGVFLLESLPDAGLWTAAKGGLLRTPEGIATQVERLLGEPRVRDHVTDLILRWLSTGKLRTSQKQDPSFTNQLRESMIEETRRFVHDALWSGNNTLAELFSADHSFVNATTAALYGLNPWDFDADWVRTPLPANQRSGLLTQPSLLTRLAGVSTTSTVQRGLFVASTLLCKAIPAPPPGVKAASQAQLDALETERARAEFRMGLPTCSACHKEFEPLGVLFENYDELGRFRSSVAGHAVDASWALPGSESWAGPTANGIEFTQRLADSPELASCLALQISGYAAGHPLSSEQTCAVQPIAAAFKQSGGRINVLLSAIASSAFFRLRKVAP